MKDIYTMKLLIVDCYSTYQGIPLFHFHLLIDVDIIINAYSHSSYVYMATERGSLKF